MKAAILSLVLLCTLLGGSALAADDDDEGSIAETHEKKSPYGEAVGNVAMTSRLHISRTNPDDHQPAVQAGMDWEHPTGFFLGIWGTNVHFPGDRHRIELDGSGGYNYNISPSLSASLGVTYYAFFQGGSLDMWEIPLKLTWKTVTASISYSPTKTGAMAEGAWYLNAGWSDKLFWDLTFGATAGYSFMESGSDLKNYADFHLNVAREVLGVLADISFYFVDHPQLHGADDPRLVFSVSKTF